jgi:hypothetical protein
MLDVAAAAPATLIGDYLVAGNALLQYAGGAIGSIGRHAKLTLTGAEARVAAAGKTGSNSALAKLAGNAGSLVLVDGASVTTAGAFDNAGEVNVDWAFGGGGSIVPTKGGSSLRIGGKLTNSHRLFIGSGRNLEAATVVKASSLSNTSTGAVVVAGGAGDRTATLLLGGASSDAGSIEVAGGILALGGVLTVTGNLRVYDGGTIEGGVLSGSGRIGSLNSGDFPTEGTLDGVTIAAGTHVFRRGGYGCAECDRRRRPERCRQSRSNLRPARHRQHDPCLGLCKDHARRWRRQHIDVDERQLRRAFLHRQDHGHRRRQRQRR